MTSWYRIMYKNYQITNFIIVCITATINGLLARPKHNMFESNALCTITHTVSVLFAVTNIEQTNRFVHTPTGIPVVNYVHATHFGALVNESK